MNVKSPVGTWGVAGSENEVTHVYLPNEGGVASRGVAPEAVARAASQLEQYFKGTRRDFTVELGLVAATPFQREVWDALSAIPFGEVRTYADIAVRVHRPRAARAVGNANHANPWPVFVPCHRVVAASGLGGYGWGERVKRFLLELEGIRYH